MFLEHRLTRSKDQTEWILETSDLTLLLLQIRKLRLREVIGFKVIQLDWIVTDLGLTLTMLSLSWQLTFGNCLILLLSDIWSDFMPM